VPDLDPTEVMILVTGLAADITRMRVDMSDYAESYYFRENDTAAALPAVIGFAVDLGNTAAASSRPGIRLSGNLLLSSLGDFADMLGERFLGGHEASTDLMVSYANDHRHEPT